MFGKKSSSAPQTSIDSLIGAGTRVEGNVFFSGGLPHLFARNLAWLAEYLLAKRFAMTKLLSS